MERNGGRRESRGGQEGDPWHLVGLWGPVALEEVLLKGVLVPSEYLTRGGRRGGRR